MPARFDRTPMITSLSNGMIEPLLPMSMTGVAFFHGESNTEAAWQYRKLLPTLIDDWRTRFGSPDLPFLIMQIANHMARADRPATTSAWAELREAQAMTAASVPGAGLVVTIDIGDALNIHFPNKQEVGRRLGLLAEAQVYKLPVAGSGPRYSGVTADGPRLRVAFAATGDLALASGAAGPVLGFSIAGEDRRFEWGEARIEGSTVIVSSVAVAKPVAVRYAWANNPACNLSDASGLPAGPFRSDDWPGVTWPAAGR